jgi:glycosyltransferase involved in cell wall biosynthesis
MKILLLSFEYPPETGFGGIGTYTWYHARALARLGHDVHVLAGSTESSELRRTEHDGVTVYRYAARLNGIRTVLDKQRLWWTKNRLENGLSMYVGLRKLLRNHDYDVVEMPECGAEGLLVNWLLPVPTVVRFHSPARLIMGCYDVRRADHVCCSALEQIGILGAARFTSCSRFLADEVRQRMAVRRHVEVIPNGIDLDLFDASQQVDVRKAHDLPTDRPVILFSGRMERRKGIHLCKEIVAEVLARHDAAFVFVGQDLFGYLEKELMPYWRQLSLRGSIHYLGKLDLTGVRSCLRQSDIVMIPSLWENCPYSGLEAMAAGKAIVSSNAGGLPEIIRDGETGLVAPSQDAAAFVERLERLIQDAALRERLGANARRSVEHEFRDERIAALSVRTYLSMNGRQIEATSHA